MNFVDLFAGGGLGARGAVMAGGKPVLAIDAWERATQTYQDNFSSAKVICDRVENVSPKKYLANTKVDLLLSSPECTNHSVAKGAAPRCEVSRATSLLTLDWVETINPRWVILENVPNMKKWHRFQELVDGLSTLGYGVSKQVLNSADFGVAQSRRRMFLLCSKDDEPNQIKPPMVARKTVSDILDNQEVWRTTPLRTDRRAKATLEKADRAIAELGSKSPFLIVYYGTDGSGGWQRIDEPLRTITTLDRFALVLPSSSGHRMRMLQPSELARAMGLPPEHKFNHGSRRDKVRLCGNGITAPVMEHVVNALVELDPSV
jgi:DNA (cytosine-5)-methyltransferase 1